jgi:hypothetical protein
VYHGTGRAREVLMTLSIDLNEQLQARLEEEARRQGVEPPEYARRLLEQSLLSGATDGGNRATLELLAAWGREDAATGAAANGQADLDELKRSLNENRTSGRKPFP